MEYFVKKTSIVREIWSKGDTILFIFAGSAAEFAVNKAVDWLYFTGRLPADPIGRLFSTVNYARKIIFAERYIALNAIDKINTIHQTVENNRGSKIPDWAYRDVLFMLIDYSIRSFELLERKLTKAEKQDVVDVFNELGIRMGLKDLPKSYTDWHVMRDAHLKENLKYSKFTTDLYKQYRKHLGSFRYQVLLQAQVLVVPKRVNHLLSLGRIAFLKPAIFIYKICRILNLHQYIKNIMLPEAYKKQIADLDQISNHMSGNIEPLKSETI
ncbi:hypothetical protein IWX76_000457 [Pedobacter sp. CAN_A7]|uniref:oxygenase MpaB family protein n=1 Tax=Pedobacter sp. CAN_A7 TaxID=2787722 RepID=UPI0018CA27E1